MRTCCAECKQPYEPDDETLDRIEMMRDQIGGRPFYFGKGCKTCNGTGYKGRKGVFEYLRISDPREDGIRNILDGYTTVDEVLRYT